MPRPASPKYRTTNWAAYNAALRQRGSLDVWFDPEMQWLSAPCGRPGRPARFSDSAIELCLTLKTLFNLPLRQATGLVASLLRLADLDWPVPDYTTLCRRQKTLPVMPGGRPSSGGLHLLIDSTGIKMMGAREIGDEWKTRKHGASYRRQWRKVHIGIAARGAHAVIPVRCNGRPWKEGGPGAVARNETLRAIKRPGRTIWKKWSGYHRHSLVETKMHCIKLLSGRVMARTFDRQITELKVRAAILNRFSQIGTPNTVRVA